MPPPTSDAWLASRRFGIVIDAGSSGSRLQIYSWIDARTVRKEGGSLDVLPKVERGTQDADKWISKVEPGLSSFAENTDGIGPYLRPLLSHANEHVPPSLQEETPLFLLATAGMRLLSDKQQKDVLAATCDFLRFHSKFKIGDASTRGPCGAHVRVISGAEEGLFGWIAVNYLMDGFHNPSHNEQPSTYGFLDMGGASTQIAFEPRKDVVTESTDGMYEVRLRLIRGDEITHDVFVTTWLGYGTNQARERYVGQTINAVEQDPLRESQKSADDKIPDPCLPKNLQRVETPVHIGESTDHTRQPHTFVGTGSFEGCLKDSLPLLNKTVTCHQPPCLFNGVHVPPIDFSVSKFIGVSEYWYSSEQAFGLGGAYDFLQYEHAASQFCASEWEDLQKQHEAARKAKLLGGDGEIEEEGEVVAVGKWGADVELSRLEVQCFKAAWIVNVLHEGIGLPRTVDLDGNATTTIAEGTKVNQKAAQKGLGAPTFQSLDTVEDTAISWTLGRMVLEASKEIPPLSASLPQLPDPLEPAEPAVLEAGPPASVSRTWAENIKAHAMTVPTVTTLILYLFSFGALLFLVYVLRHRIRSSCRHFRLRNRRRDYASVEEGKLPNGHARYIPLSAQHSRSTSPEPEASTSLSSSQTIRRVASTASSGSISLRMKPVARSSRSSPIHSPKRSSSPNGNSTLPTDQTVETQIVPSSHPLYALSMSRTSSQVNLVPRQAGSRAGAVPVNTETIIR